MTKRVAELREAEMAMRIWLRPYEKFGASSV
jgi:hypothetical protein